MNYLFFNQSHKLRSGWRAVIFLFTFIFIAVAVSTAVQTAVSIPTVEAGTTKLLFFAINSLGLLLLALLLGAAAGRIFELLPFRALGASFTSGWLRHLALGIGIGAATFVLAVVIAFVSGGLSFELNLSAGAGVIAASMGISFFLLALRSAWEEAFFRGYLLQTFTRSGLASLAVMLTAIFFGIVHLANDNSTAISTVNTTLAGVWFALAYLKTRDLWFVWGLHLMWNWTQGSVFGIEVSGLTDMAHGSLFKEIDSGPAWLTGGDYGIEGGVACTFALILSMALIHFLPMSVTPAKEV